MKIKQSKIGISTAFVVALATALSGCAKDDANQYRYGLFSSEVISDECEIADTVNRYFSSGERGNVPPRSPSSLKELFYGDLLAYDVGEVEYYEVRYENRYVHLLQYIASQENFNLRQSCSTVMDIEGSGFVPERNRYVRNGSSEIYRFRAKGRNRLCLHDLREGGRFFSSSLWEACINTIDLSTQFDVSLAFPPEYSDPY